MSSTPSQDEVFHELMAGVPELLGAEAARMISISVLALAVYDWMLTLDIEVKYFWKGPWTLSRCLFLVNRYFVPLLLLYVVILFSILNPTDALCRRALQAGFFLHIIALSIIQVMLVLRVWYLFQSETKIRAATIICFVITFIVSMYYAHELADRLTILPRPAIGIDILGCRAARPPHYWRILVPSLVLHTVIYALTAVSAWRHRHLFETAPLLKRLLRDGGFFYLVVLVSVLFTAICSFLDQYPIVNIPAIYSSYNLAFTSIALSRLMLSIHSFSSHQIGVSANKPWMLSLNELSRVQWRPGQQKCEIIVEGAYGGGDSIFRNSEDGASVLGRSESNSTLGSLYWGKKMSKM